MARVSSGGQDNLERKISEKRTDVQNDRLSMSIGELAGVYERRELDIHPKFQRVFRWQNDQKTKLIESVLLRIPIPPIFISQDADGYWDVVDGVQRLGTILEFLGILKQADGASRPALRLSGTQLLPELDGVLFDSENAEDKVFSPSMRLDFRRSRLDLNIILKESTPSSKYELFERLNTGGSLASGQEVRNCVLVWMNEQFFDWMVSLEGFGPFVECTPLSDRLADQQFRMELLLRFLVLHGIDVSELRGLNDIGDFLNRKNRSLASSNSVDCDSLGRTFKATFGLLGEALGGDAFRKFDVVKKRFTGAFLISSFEVVALGVAFNIEAWKSDGDAVSKIRAKVESLWNEKSFTDNIGIGVSSSSRMVHTVPLGRTYFRP